MVHLLLAPWLFMIYPIQRHALYKVKGDFCAGSRGRQGMESWTPQVPCSQSERERERESTTSIRSSGGEVARPTVCGYAQTQKGLLR